MWLYRGTLLVCICLLGLGLALPWPGGTTALHCSTSQIHNLSVAVGVRVSATRLEVPKHPCDRPHHKFVYFNCNFTIETVAKSLTSQRRRGCHQSLGFALTPLVLTDGENKLLVVAGSGNFQFSKCGDTGEICNNAMKCMNHNTAYHLTWHSTRTLVPTIINTLPAWHCLTIIVWSRCHFEYRNYVK